MLSLLFLFAGHSPPKRLVCLCHKPRGETVLHSLHHSLLLLCFLILNTPAPRLIKFLISATPQLEFDLEGSAILIALALIDSSYLLWELHKFLSLSGFHLQPLPCF